MNEKRFRVVKIAVTAAVVVGGLGYLLVASTSSAMEYYKHVDEVIGQEQAWRHKRLQVHGHVVAGSIRKIPGTLDWRFEVEHNGKTLRVHYLGIVPDTFKDGSEVVCKGQLGVDGTLEVSSGGVMAKCPSKYDGKDPAAGKAVHEALGSKQASR
jgi:cytochrome c-type biogenesis protein CcmE